MLARTLTQRASTTARRSFTTTASAPRARTAVPKKLIIGATAAAAVATVYYTLDQEKAKAAEQKKRLDTANFVDLKVAKVTDVNHNTKIITLALDDQEVLGMAAASCVYVKLPNVVGDDGKPIIRPYTPLDADTVGFTELLIKKYKDGKLTPKIFDLKAGDVVQMKGPIQKFLYKANSKKEIGLIAGGTGLTPMLQVADTILRNPEDKTKVTFVFANIAEEDILLRKQLDERAAKHSNFTVHYVLEKPPQGWNGSTGYVSKEIIQKYMPAPGADNVVMVCGPPPMMKAISGSKAPDYTQGELAGLLLDLGYTKEQVFKF